MRRQRTGDSIYEAYPITTKGIIVAIYVTLLDKMVINWGHPTPCSKDNSNDVIGQKAKPHSVLQAFSCSSRIPTMDCIIMQVMYQGRHSSCVTLLALALIIIPLCPIMFPAMGFINVIDMSPMNNNRIATDLLDLAIFIYLPSIF